MPSLLCAMRLANLQIPWGLGLIGANKLLAKLERVKLLIQWTGEDYEMLRKWLNSRARYLTKELELFNDMNQLCV